MAITLETISVNRYAPEGSGAVNLYSNGLDGGDHLTIGQLVVAVSMRSAAAYEAQSIMKMNAMASGSSILEKSARYLGQIADGSANDEWAAIKAFLVNKLGVTAELPAEIDTYSKRMEAIGIVKSRVDALAQTQQTDMIDLQTLVNRRDVAFEASSNMVRALGKSQNGNAGNF